MKKLFIFLALFIFLSCDDKQKKEQALKDLQFSEQAYENIQKQINELEHQVTKLTGELEVAKDDINQVKEFHFLRSESERERQIKEAIEYKIKIENTINNVKHQIANLNDSLIETDTKISSLKLFITN